MSSPWRLLPLVPLVLFSAGSVPMTDRLKGAEPDSFRPPAIATEDVPVVPRELIERLRQYQAVRSAGFAGWSPDGRGILIATRFGDTMQLHRVYEPGGRREQITFFIEPVGGRFIPDSTEGDLLMTMSEGGSENNQIYFYDAPARKVHLLTDGASRNLMGPVRLDGSKMVIASNRRNGRDTDLYLADPRTAGSAAMLMQVDGEFWTATDFSHDGSKLLLNRYVSINETYPALFDVATRERRMLPIPSGGPAAFTGLRFSPDGKSAWLATDVRGEFRQLARLDLASGEYEWFAADIPWDVDEIEVDPRSGQVAFTVNEDGASALYLLENGTPRRVEVPLGIIGSLEFSPDGKQLGLTLARPDAPADAYSIALGDKSLARWTYSELGGLDPEAFVTPTRIQFPSFDGRMIPAYYFRPRGASKDRPVPVLIDIHGGPESQYRPSFSGLDQFYVGELGVAVIHPNVRGSSGYGKSYLRLDNAERREDSVRDIGALLEWIAKQPELDASRVAVSGGSYGGYMVLASLVHYGERIRAGVDIVGIASFRTFLTNTAAYRQDLRRAEYGDERDPRMQEFFEKIDPLENVERIRSSLLVAHGRNDPRVPFSEAQQIARQVRASGRTVWSVYADNEGHGFAKKPNRDYLTAVTVMFLKDALVPHDAAP